VECLEKRHCAGRVGTPECDVTKSVCVECVGDAGCGGTTPICVGNKCIKCSTDEECKKKDSGKGVCLETGEKAGMCVECKDNAGCSAIGKVCNLETNTCVECVNHSTCKGGTPLCVGNRCVSCNAGEAGGCKVKSAETPVCATSGMCVECTSGDGSRCSATGKVCKVEASTCVECLGDEQCGNTKPICNTKTNQCEGCTTDTQCTGIGSGVCMPDGHCATEGESIVVTSTSGNLPKTAADLGGKLVVVIEGRVDGAVDWTLGGRTEPVVVVGQSNGILAGNGVSTTVEVSGGDVYIRNLNITGAGPNSYGLAVAGGGTIHLDNVKVFENPGGGIVIENAGFEITNTTIDHNGTEGRPVGDGLVLRSIPASGRPRSLTNTSVTNNTGSGIMCATPSDTPSPASGILLSGNGTSVTGCAFPSGATCTEGGPMCGAP